MSDEAELQFLLSYFLALSSSMANPTLSYRHAYTFFTRSDTEDVDPSVLQLFISENVTSQYFFVAQLTVLVYYASSYDKILN
ncbi:uncharacterized protein FOMMEDRAFT_159281 [Fomitiporia mediterranea MF3/22]|uniref:uncharacterized protein n=1 Tax=Fomitiporia mediterranea (strain MF3/22) TaxID=694068 RepID=UPI00044090AF|nr:uncharacterized protein FOMMEDRAFT_159281 [Fomitiporia mediterranea MF3/22]EJD00545.1 hypothetical protein FOMMEDRAFT_159281 [Fomitiporia mediterranea MF3/22]